jgi:phosphoglucosamine mutase
MNPRLFGTSGVRRRVSELSNEFVLKLAYSLGTYSRDEKIAVGRDTRSSSKRLADEFISGLLASGHDVVDLGVAPTPTVAMASEEYGTGVVVTASHNPPEWNGFKFWSDGRAYSPEQENSVEGIVYSNSLGEFKGVNPGSAVEKDYRELYINRILGNVGSVDRRVKVLVDCANGAGAVVTPLLLERMGCDVVAVNTEMDGKFAHGLEPTAENLRETCELVRESDVDVGLAHDGDADRVAVIGRDGFLIDWDSFLAVLAYGRNRVVTTVDASMRIDDVCREVVRTPIGDVAVANEISRVGADFGGEPSGSIIFPEVHLFPDGPLAAAKIVKMVSEDRFYETLNKIKGYPTERVKCFYGEGQEPAELMREIKKRLLEEFEGDIREVNEIDGIRIKVDGGWFLTRPSGTEPCIRITAEAQSESILKSLMERSKSCVNRVIES